MLSYLLVLPVLYMATVLIMLFVTMPLIVKLDGFTNYSLDLLVILSFSFFLGLLIHIIMILDLLYMKSSELDSEDVNVER